MFDSTLDRDELKALLILGPDYYINFEITNIYDREGFIIIGDGKNQEIDIEFIEQVLIDKNYMLGKNTRIDICAHGDKTDDSEHLIRLTLALQINTKIFLKNLCNKFGQLNIHLWSCYAGLASNEIISLKLDSTLTTHSDASNLSSIFLSTYSLKQSLLNYSNVDLGPCQKFIKECKYYYEPTTLFIVNENFGFIKSLEFLKPELLKNLIKKLNLNNDIISIVTETLITNIIVKEFLYEFMLSNLELEVSKQEAQDYLLALKLYLAGLFKEKDYFLLKDLIIGIKNLGIDFNDMKFGVTPLFIAAQEGNNEILQLLLKAGADPNLRRPIGSTLPIIVAAQNGHMETVTILLDGGANPNLSNANNITALFFASQQNHLNVIKLLLQVGADPSLCCADDGMTPLIISTIRRHIDIVEELLKARTNPNQYNIERTTPLFFAAQYGLI